MLKLREGKREVAHYSMTLDPREQEADFPSFSSIAFSAFSDRPGCLWFSRLLLGLIGFVRFLFSFALKEHFSNTEWGIVRTWDYFPSSFSSSCSSSSSSSSSAFGLPWEHCVSILWEVVTKGNPRRGKRDTLVSGFVADRFTGVKRIEIW